MPVESTFVLFLLTKEQFSTFVFRFHLIDIQTFQLNKSFKLLHEIIIISHELFPQIKKKLKIDECIH